MGRVVIIAAVVCMFHSFAFAKTGTIPQDNPQPLYTMRVSNSSAISGPGRMFAARPWENPRGSGITVPLHHVSRIVFEPINASLVFFGFGALSIRGWKRKRQRLMNSTLR